MTHILQQHLLRINEEGRRAGIYSVCSAHPWVLRAAVEQAREDGSLLLMEATSNQVNQTGGYTGMRPADFRRFAEDIADAAGFDRSRLVLGGDHLGPNPWRTLEPEAAMAHALVMVAEYAAAGFSKIHLDASMPCAGEGAVLTDEVVATRAARLCIAAEQAAAEAGLPGPVYVIGTEVPTPGGATHDLGELPLTSTDAAQLTLEVHKAAFARYGLQAAWKRVIALVVQPGVEFDHHSVVDYTHSKAVALKEWLRLRATALVFEAHSTDYQKPTAYAELVQDGFAILKVGPALTFAMREALFALATMEQDLASAGEVSQLIQVVEQTMLAAPAAWKPYYGGEAQEQKRLRVYSYSDRMRYYWNHPAVEAAVARLIENLGRTGIPETMLSAYLPKQYERVRAGTLKNDAQMLIVDKIQDVLRVYAAAC
jgi:D-tagatose-1,6-bisphosphate aldolase subunit GatZ/KbaZ